MQRLNDLPTLLLAIHLLDDALVDALALVPKSGLEAERRAFVGLHDGDAGRDRLEEGDRAQVRFDVVVVLVALFLGPVQRFLVRVLAVRDEAFIARPAGLGD